VDVLHELRDFHREVFVVVHVARSTLLLLPTVGDLSYGDAFRLVGLMLGPKRRHNCGEVRPPRSVFTCRERSCCGQTK